MENLKRTALEAGLEDLSRHGDLESDDSGATDDRSSQGSRSDTPVPKAGKKTRGRVKINMEFIDNKLRRYTTFSKRKSGIMKKAHELATLTGTQVMLLVASETGHVYTFATRKLQPILSSEAGKQLIQTCLNSPDQTESTSPPSHQDDQRMSAQGFEEPELTYAPTEDTKDGLLQKTYHILNAMSVQQHDRSTTPQHRHNPEPQVSSVSLPPISGSGTESIKTTSLHFPAAQSFALFPPQSGSPLLDQSPLHLASSAASGSRMHMTPVTHDTSCHPLTSSDLYNPHNVRAAENDRLAIINSYNSLQRPVTGVQPLLVAGAGHLPIPNAQVALFDQSDNNDNKKHQR